MMKHYINEVFWTLQGEGSHTGTPSLFVRWQVCGVGCPWCDTGQTWHLNFANLRDQATVLQKCEPSAEFAEFTDDELVAIALSGTPRHVVITGGEPCLDDLTELTTKLIDKGFTVQIETSGTQPVRVHPDTFVTVSPKVNMPGKFPVLRDALARANEIKMPVGKNGDICALLKLLKFVPIGRLIYVQPISGSKKATDICREAAMKHNLRVSIQVHRLLDWR